MRGGPGPHHRRGFWEQYLGPGGDPADPLASPAVADPAGLPPAHVLTAGCDPLRDEGAAYVRALRAAGTEAELDHHPGMFHGFLALADVLPQARQAVRRLGGVISSTANDGKTSGGVGGATG
ncbi:alpha/beta hydrolase fold domain-containing protein [Streptomyces goshikiensis]|uniref:alpha/beta hydrolase fold domain-containing protein n=1 Tax=Streptomyces goshikiensis TaxID=1942 RepID=UPI0036D0E885